MYAFADPEPPRRQMVSAIRANSGPLMLAVAMLVVARISQVVTYDPAVKGLTLAAVLETALVVAAFGLSTLTGCWAVLTGGRPAGFRALRAFPAERLLAFVAYTVVFVLWFLVLNAILTRLAEALLGGDGGLLVAAVTGAITAAMLLAMYVQLGILFPDMARTGETSIMFAMALGISSAARIIATLAAPIAALILPGAVLEGLAFDPTGMVRAAAAFPGLLDLAAMFVVAALSVLGWAACAVGMSRIYEQLSPGLQAGTWR